MNKFFLILCILTFSNIAKSQTKALTEFGREVVLFSDGTWKFSQSDGDEASISVDSLKINQVKFKRTDGVTFLVKSKTFNVGVFMNPDKWIFAGHADNEINPEYRFSLKAGEGQALMITEKTQISLESLRKIALLNAQKASVDVKETFAEYRMVNDKKVLCLKLEGTIQGIQFIYFGYYYSNPNGTVQLISYTSRQFFDNVHKDLEDFLNGIVELDN